MVMVVHEAALQVIRDLAPVVPRIARQDRDLARQLRRAAQSVVLNIAEGEMADPGTKRARFQSAAGSANETRAALRIALAWRYLPAGQGGQEGHVGRCLDGLDRVVAMLWRLTH